MDFDSDYLKCSAEIDAARRAGRALVALESTLITHGMPWPRNLETALAAEAVVREAGACPATIALMDGRLRVGLAEAELERLARAGTGVAKCSRRDLALLLRSGATAGTTVAATMIIAARAGIRVFATGGIGGVHRGASSSFDISADLQELARTPVAVVCAGPKAILDLRLTLEYLETQGVPVIGYRSAALPGFYVRDSGLRVPHRLDTPAEIAAVLRTHWALGLDSGAVIANPLPEADALDPAMLEQGVVAALRDAREQGVSGKDITPFLLGRVGQLTGGASLEANVSLVLANARLAGEIASALASGHGPAAP